MLAIAGAMAVIAVVQPPDVAYDGNTICGNAQNVVLIGEAEAPDPATNEICEDDPAE